MLDVSKETNVKFLRAAVEEKLPFVVDLACDGLPMGFSCYHNSIFEFNT